MDVSRLWHTGDTAGAFKKLKTTAGSRMKGKEYDLLVIGTLHEVMERLFWDGSTSTTALTMHDEVKAFCDDMNIAADKLEKEAREFIHRHSRATGTITLPARENERDTRKLGEILMRYFPVQVVIDLSKRCIDRAYTASARNLDYGELVEGELTTFLKSADASYFHMMYAFHLRQAIQLSRPQLLSKGPACELELWVFVEKAKEQYFPSFVHLHAEQCNAGRHSCTTTADTGNLQCALALFWFDVHHRLWQEMHEMIVEATRSPLTTPRELKRDKHSKRLVVIPPNPSNAYDCVVAYLAGWALRALHEDIPAAARKQGACPSIATADMQLKAVWARWITSNSFSTDDTAYVQSANIPVDYIHEVQEVDGPLTVPSKAVLLFIAHVEACYCAALDDVEVVLRGSSMMKDIFDSIVSSAVVRELFTYTMDGQDPRGRDFSFVFCDAQRNELMGAVLLKYHNVRVTNYLKKLRSLSAESGKLKAEDASSLRAGLANTSAEKMEGQPESTDAEDPSIG